MKKISNFYLAKYILQSISKNNNINFYDLQLCFKDAKDEEIGLTIDYKLCVGNPQNVNSVIFNIIYGYIKNIEIITGQPKISIDKKNLYIYLSNVLRGFTYDGKYNIDKFVNIETETRLYSFSNVYILMKDLIGPAFNINYYDIEILLKNVSCEDYCELKSKENTKYIQVNSGISYQPVRDAFVLKSCVQAFGKNSTQLFNELVNSKYFDKVKGFAKLAYKDEEYNDFMKMLECFGGKKDVNIGQIVKTANSKNVIKTAFGENGSFWFLGLLEGMLESHRGSDWSTYEALQPYHKEVFDKVQRARAKKGRDGLSYQALLRQINGQNSSDDNQLIQKNLGSHRIW